jgi:HAAS
MSTDRAMAAVNQYVARLQKAFAHVPSAERDELVEEVRSHVLERIAAEPHVTEDVVSGILRAVGDPEELASQHGTQDMLRRAATSRSPWVLLTSTVRWATTGIAGVIALFVTLTGYGCAAVCYLCVLLKPLFPARIGLWLSAEHFATLGYWDGRFSGTHVYGISVRPPVSFVLGTLGPTGPVRELLGPWLIPVAFLGGGLFVVATTLLTRRFIRRFGLWTQDPSLRLEPAAAGRLLFGQDRKVRS